MVSPKKERWSHEAEKDNTRYYALSLEEIYNKFRVDPQRGLSGEQAVEHLHKYGINEVKKVKRSFYKVIIAPIINLLIIIYLISAIAMAALGEVRRTTPTFIIVGFNILVAIIQQYRAERKLEALHKLSQASTIVIRDGKQMKIPTNRVVKGDIILLSRGDKVPADCRIIEGTNLQVDESSLTGESEPVRKSTNGEALPDRDLPIQDQRNMLFLGTFISSGNCKAVVVRIGSETEIGEISSLLEQSNTGDIPLRRKMNDFAKYLGYGVLTLLILSIIRKSILLRDLGQLNWDTFRIALIDSIDLGMKVMPINLPLLTTIILLTGVLAMARQGVIVRDLSRTESLGRVSVVCSDKTGTLTKNEMTVIKLWLPGAEYDVTGKGFSPDGEIIPVNGAESPGDNPDLSLFVLSGYLNNNSSLVRERYKTLHKDKFIIKWSIIGLPTEGALRVLGKKYDPEIDKKEKQYTLIHEFPFDSSLKRMSKLFKKDGKYYMFTKGATEWVLKLCAAYRENGNINPLNPDYEQKVLRKIDEYANQGYRILGLAYKEPDANDLPGNFDGDNVREKLERDLIFLGFVVIYDPPRDDVFDAINECKEAGIEVKLITGDNLKTGIAIGKILGIYEEGKNIGVEGKDIEALDDDRFNRVSCFGRVTPIHKQIIVKRYQNLGKIVSMSGDGVNDALALAMADCGLAMGIQGTEVAKEAADMIITDDSFSTIVVGIREGRGLFEKIRSIVYFFLAISIMEALILFSSTLGKDPYFAMFDYWQLNLLYVTAHMFPTFGIILGNIPRDIMKEKPRESAAIVSKDLFKLMVVHMVTMGISIISVYYLTYFGYIGVNEFNLSGIGYGDPAVSVPNNQIKARTMAFVVLFILESVILPVQIRRFNKSFAGSLNDIKYKEWHWYTTSIIILVVLIYALPIQEWMGLTLHWPVNFMYLSLSDWAIVLGFSLFSFISFELIRKRARKNGVYF